MAADASLLKKVSLVLVVVFILVLISDGDVWQALRYHEPSNRIFRALLQVNLVLFGTAFSLYVWSKTIPNAVTAELLFAPVVRSADDVDAGSYYASVQDDDDGTDEGDEQDDLISSEELPPPPLREDLALDADYASEGEISEPLPKQTDTLPTPAAVLHTALDLLLMILITLFLFNFTSSSAQSTPVWRIFSRVTAPTFPLILFVYLTYRLFFPWSQRKAFIVVLYTTLAAPWYPVTFRDGFIGDILTSTVRPLQDISFTILYILFGLRSWYSSHYFTQDFATFIDHADASVPVMERSWLLHTIALPMCMVSPLWYRFLQNLRQTRDYRRRWPYLGNALKYFVAAQVAMFGVFQPAHKKTALWLTSFVLATLYQVWWDVFMDWSLLERRNGGWRLREKRLYRQPWVYWTIFVINFGLRFCWTLSFLPLRYLNATGVLTNNFKGDLHAFFGPTIAVAEIIRRTLWGLLRVEWEAVQVTKSIAPESDDTIIDKHGCADDSAEEEDDAVEMIPMNMQGLGDTTIPLSSRGFPSLVDMSSMDSMQVYLELGLYAASFCLIGLVAAAHRGTF